MLHLSGKGEPFEGSPRKGEAAIDVGVTSVLSSERGGGKRACAGGELVAGGRVRGRRRDYGKDRLLREEAHSSTHPTRARKVKERITGGACCRVSMERREIGNHVSVRPPPGSAKDSGQGVSDGRGARTLHTCRSGGWEWAWKSELEWEERKEGLRVTKILLSGAGNQLHKARVPYKKRDRRIGYPGDKEYRIWPVEAAINTLPIPVSSL
ncbi:hypothetical protein Tco_0180241 [Tanacetum coccineum]